VGEIQSALIIVLAVSAGSTARLTYPLPLQLRHNMGGVKHKIAHYCCGVGEEWSRFPWSDGTGPGWYSLDCSTATICAWRLSAMSRALPVIDSLSLEANTNWSPLGGLFELLQSRSVTRVLENHMIIYLDVFWPPGGSTNVVSPCSCTYNLSSIKQQCLH